MARKLVHFLEHDLNQEPSYFYSIYLSTEECSYITAEFVKWTGTDRKTSINTNSLFTSIISSFTPNHFQFTVCISLHLHTVMMPVGTTKTPAKTA